MLLFIYIALINIVALIILTVANIRLLNFIHKTVLKEFNNSGSVPSALKKLDRLSYYYLFGFLIPTGILFPVLIIFLALMILHIMAKNVGDGFYSDLGMVSGLVSAILYIFPSMALSDSIFDKTRGIVRKTEVISYITLISMLKELANESVVLQSFLFLAILGLVFLLPIIELNILLWVCIPILIVAVAAVAIIATEFIYPWWNSRSLALVPLKNEHLKHMINEFLVQQNADEIVVFEFASIEDKYVNAFADGLFRKRIYFSDYLLHEFTHEEVKAILAHEIYHLKNWHVFVQMILVLMSLFVSIFGMQITYKLIDVIEIMGLYLTSPVYFIAIHVFLILISATFLLYILKLHERQADEYVVRSGIAPDVLISALTKLTLLNDEPKSIGKLKEKFSTHPSLENRIKYINEFAESLGKRKDV